MRIINEKIVLLHTQAGLLSVNDHKFAKYKKKTLGSVSILTCMPTVYSFSTTPFR